MRLHWLITCLLLCLEICIALIGPPGRLVTPKQHPSCLTVHDKATGCTVYLQGCLHGSPTSGNDISALIQEVQPAAIVLELCDNRYKSLRREDKIDQGSSESSGAQQVGDIISNWFRGLRSLAQRKGAFQAVTAAALSSGYLLQKLNGYDPGLEFKTAMRLAESGSVPVVLGDRDIELTLSRLNGRTDIDRNVRDLLQADAETLPATVKQKLERTLTQTVSDLKVIKMSVLGDAPDSLNAFACIFGRAEVVKNLATLLGPLLVVVYGMSLLLHLVLGDPATVADVISDPVAQDLADVTLAAASSTSLQLPSGASDIMNQIGVVLNTGVAVASTLLTLRFFRLVIYERDIYLAQALQQACRDHPGSSVIAVVGLLHCNGVAKMLREYQEGADIAIDK